MGLLLFPALHWDSITVINVHFAVCWNRIADKFDLRVVNNILHAKLADNLIIQFPTPSPKSARSLLLILLYPTLQPPPSSHKTMKTESEPVEAKGHMEH